MKDNLFEGASPQVADKLTKYLVCPNNHYAWNLPLDSNKYEARTICPLCKTELVNPS